MKTKIKLLLSILFLSTGLNAQEKTNAIEKNAFVEWNFGAAYTYEEFIFPGTSVLWGKTYINETDFVFEYEAGFALPSLVTGKLGIGKKINNTKVIMGVRPYPFNLFLQSSFTNGKKGYWICSIEFNPLNDDNEDFTIAFGSKAILNFGYRWYIFKNE
ncbi:MAG: hypothetical protein KJN66_08935 [Bacteroidia bacterium]|nr:hypothetical protein [Bacteroidia bacterium]